MSFFQILKKDNRTNAPPSDGAPVSIAEVRTDFLDLQYQINNYNVEFYKLLIQIIALNYCWIF